MIKVNQQRVRILKDRPFSKGAVIYWMSRDQRLKDNWALFYAQQLAHQLQQPLGVAFCLVPHFLSATIRQYTFMLKGLRQLVEEAQGKNIAFYLLTGNPEDELARFVKDHNIGALVTDFDPLRVKTQWKRNLAKRITIPFYEVDTHNIVPCWVASGKLEYGAYTIRPKIKKLLKEFLEEFPQLKKHLFSWPPETHNINWRKAKESLKVDRIVQELSWLGSGERDAFNILRFFLQHKLKDYYTSRSDPTKDGTSNLSVYLHFGQISAQRVALEVSESIVSKKSKDAFLEELIIRRELSDNFCFYNNNYDNFEGLPAWAKQTLNVHRSDRREYLYSKEDFERAKTHDQLWNAAQMQMIKTGKMHGYMRMYWAKKILEWTKSPEDAFNIAIYLNDKYELDGRDPNSYAGVAWAIGGLYGRAWPERSVYGKIRYMSHSSAESKFDVAKYSNFYL